MNHKQIRIIILLILIGYITITITNEKYKRTPIRVMQKIKSRSIKKQIADTVSEKVVIPKHYYEMDNLYKGFLNSLESENVSWKNIIKIGDIYSTGIYPFLRPDDVCARQCFTVVSKCPDPKISSIALSRLINIVNNPLDKIDREGEQIDPKYSINLSKIANNYINSLPQSAFTRSKNRYDSDKTIYLPAHVPKKAPENITTVLHGDPILIDVVHNHDKQNVHDHGVSSAIKTNIGRLRDDFSSKKHWSNEKIVDNAMKICKDVLDKSKNDNTIKFTNDDLADAHRAIVSLTNDKYSTTELTQIQILGRILQKIEEIEKDQKDIAINIKETFAKRMASAVEHGKIVCASGKISRALSIFEGVLEDSQKSVPMDVVRKEFGFLAEKIRNDYLENVGPSGRKAYNTLASVPRYSQDMRDIFRSKVNDKYIKELGMSSKIIDPVVEVYCEAF